VASQGLRASLIWASWAAKSWNNWFLLFAKANQILIIIYMDFLVYIIFYFEYILHITKTNVGHVILNIWKEGITSTVQLVQIQVHVRSQTALTSLVQYISTSGLALQMIQMKFLKYACVSSVKGSKADSGAKKRLRKNDLSALRRLLVFCLICVNLICCHKMHVLHCDNTAILCNKHCPRDLIVLALKRTSSIALTALWLTVIATLTV